MPGLSAKDLEGLTPAEFGRLVKKTPYATLSETMKSDLRDPILDTIFERLPSLFRPERAGSTNAMIHWHITGRPDGGSDVYQLVIADRACSTAKVDRGAADEDGAQPRLTITIGAVELLQLIAGTTNPTMMFMMGKIKAKGDLALAASFANLFNMPRI